MNEIHLTGGPIESEFKEDPDFYVLFATNNLQMGRMIASSKSSYCQEHQGELVIFNANIITETRGKIWYGDVNINLDFDNLKNVADKIGEDLYILLEGDARFGYENQPIKVLISKEKTIIRCNKNLKEKKKIVKRKTKKKKNEA